MALRYWVGGTGTWDQASTTHWASSSGGASGASVPTSSDDVIFDVNSGTGTCTISASAPCNSLATAGSTLHTIALSASVTLTLGSSAAGNGNIAIDLSGLTTLTLGSNTLLSFASTSATVQTCNFNSLTLGSVTFNGVGGSWQLTGGMITAAGGTVTLTNGTLDTNGQTCTWGAFTSGSGTRTLTLGTSTINVINASGTLWQIAPSTGATVNASSSTINFSDTSSGAKAITPNTFTYGTVVLAGGLGTITLNSTATFGTLQINAPATVTMAANQTKTVSHFLARGSSGNTITLQSSTNGTAWTLSKSSGTTQAEFCSIRDSTATGGGAFFAGNSTNVSGNTGWTFSDPGALSASQGLTGQIVRGRFFSGALNYTGLSNQQTGKAFPATGSFSGSNTNATVHVLPAALTSAGSALRQTSRALAATLSLSGAFLWVALKIFLAALTFTGTFGIRTSLVRLLANLTPNGNLDPILAWPLTAALSFAGGVSRLTGRPFVPILSFSGNLARLRSHFILQATLTTAGAFKRAITYPVPGALTMVAGRLRPATSALTASLSPSGVANMGLRVSGLLGAAALSFSGVAAKTAQPGSLRASLGSSGSLGTGGPLLTKVFTATLMVSTYPSPSLFPPLILGAPSSTLTWILTRPLLASLPPSGDFTRAISHNLDAAVLGFVGATLRALTRALPAAALSFTGAVAKLSRRVLAAVLSSGGAINRTYQKALAAALGLTGALRRQALKILAGGLGPQGAVLRALRRALGASQLTFAGAVARRWTTVLSAALTFTGSAAKQTARSLAGALTSAGAVSKLRLLNLAASLGLSGLVPLVRTKNLSGGLSFVGNLPGVIGQISLIVFQVVRQILAQTGPITAPAMLSHASYDTEERTAGTYVISEDPDTGALTIYRG